MLQTRKLLSPLFVRQFSFTAIARSSVAAPASPAVNPDSPKKPDMRLLSRIRKENEGLSITRVKEALLATDNNYEKAMDWLNEQLRKDGQKRAVKVQNRQANEGYVVMAEFNGIGAAMLEVNCETDFVARNEIFQKLAGRIGTTALLLSDIRQQKSHDTPNGRFHDISIEQLLAQPLLPELDGQDSSYAGLDKLMNGVVGGESVATNITDTIALIGENVRIKRGILTNATVNGASSVTKSVIASFMHGRIPVPSSLKEQQLRLKMGKIGSLLQVDLQFESNDMLLKCTNPPASIDKLAQHVVGMNPSSLDELLQQPFLFDTEKTVSEILEEMKKESSGLKEIRIANFIRFECGNE